MLPTSSGSARPRLPKTALTLVVAAVAATGLTALTASSAAAAPDDREVASLSELTHTGVNCTGTLADPTVITVAADISDPYSTFNVECHAVLDLAGHDITLYRSIIAPGEALTIEDTSGDGTLTTDARSGYATAAIHNTDATLTVNGGKITAFGAFAGAGIGGGWSPGGTTVINGGTVNATGGTFGAGLGGGRSGHGGAVTINDGTVTAAGGDMGAGIGGGLDGSGGTTVINGGMVTATDHNYGAGIGGGGWGSGGDVTVTGGVVTATGGGDAAGIGGGFARNGGTTTITGGDVTASGGSSALGSGSGAATFGSVAVTGGVLHLPSGILLVQDGAGTEILVGPDGVLAGSSGPDPTYAFTLGLGQIDNGGRILLPGANVTGDHVTVRDRHYVLSFDPNGGTTTGATTVTVFADTLGRGDRALPTEPTNAGLAFAGWNTEADGSGDPIDATSVLPGASPDGVPVQVTAYAQWVHSPAITGIAPASGPQEGGTEVVITGTGFDDVEEVVFGTTGPATSFTVDSATQITAVSPASTVLATRHVRVLTAVEASPAVAEDRFTYQGSAPAVTGVAPATGTLDGGTEVVITGTGFLDATKVFFGSAGDATSFTVDSDSQITAYSPASSLSGVRHVRVRTAAGTSPAVTADRFTYRNPAPAITGLDPSSGPVEGGTVVVISGTGFDEATKVLFGTAGEASFTVDSDTQITAISPAATAGTRHVRVRTPGGTSPTLVASRFTWR